MTIFQVLVALVYGFIGVMKMVTWRSFVAAIPVPVPVVFALGIVEVAGALGLIAPLLVRTPARLAPAAACVLAATAALALGVHAMRAEWSLVRSQAWRWSAGPA